MTGLAFRRRQPARTLPAAVSGGTLGYWRRRSPTASVIRPTFITAAAGIATATGAAYGVPLSAQAFAGTATASLTGYGASPGPIVSVSAVVLTATAIKPEAGIIWISPSAGASVRTTDPVVFKSMAGATPARFNLQVDTTPSFTAPLDYYSDLGGFQYWDGSAWQALTSAGLPTASSGNNVRFTYELPAGSIHIRVRQSL